ncbi:MAG: PIN domain-containing protein, partial [Proteobacteria bacterium]
MCLLKQLHPQIGNALFNEYLDVCYRSGIVSKSRYSEKEIEEVLKGFVSVCKWNKPQFLWR